MVYCFKPNTTSQTPFVAADISKLLDHLLLLLLEYFPGTKILVELVDTARSCSSPLGSMSALCNLCHFFIFLQKLGSDKE